MDEVKWLEINDVAVHAFRVGRTRSVCGQIHLPVGFHAVTKVDLPRCKSCQRSIVQKLSQEWAATEDPVVRWREHAARAVMGDGWSYAEVASMPSWKEAVDRVAVGLAEAFREGMLQGSAASRTDGQ